MSEPADIRTLAVRLRDTVAAAALRFRRMSANDVARKPAPKKWSKKEILGHLIDSAANNHQRFVRGQFGGELALPGYEQDAWVASQDYQAADWSQLVDLWKAYNEHLAHVLARIPPERLQTSCVIGSGKPVTLAFLAEDYFRHLEHHLAQIEPATAAR